jgi:hypothetical protein
MGIVAIIMDGQMATVAATVMATVMDAVGSKN